jgi:NADPH:quinone reductase-like Zn-dependent oxidoreductase
MIYGASGAIGTAAVLLAKHLGAAVSTDFGPKGQIPVLAALTAVPSRLEARRVSLPIPRYRQKDVLFLKGLIEAGAYRAVIDSRYPLDEVVAATRYVESEQKTDNVVLVVGS